MIKLTIGTAGPPGCETDNLTRNSSIFCHLLFDLYRDINLIESSIQETEKFAIFGKDFENFPHHRNSESLPGPGDWGGWVNSGREFGRLTLDWTQEENDQCSFEKAACTMYHSIEELYFQSRRESWFRRLPLSGVVKIRAASLFPLHKAYVSFQLCLSYARNSLFVRHSSSGGFQGPDRGARLIRRGIR
jgi:hypothetical protein